MKIDVIGLLRTKAPNARQRESAARQRGSFEVWVTHMFVIADLTGQNTDSGDGLLLAPGDGGRVKILAQLELR